MDQTPTARQILSYWHKIEFFQSTNISELQSTEKSIVHLSEQELKSNPNCLPWFNQEVIHRAKGNLPLFKPYDYHLYLGLFLRSEVFDLANKVFNRFSTSFDAESQKGQGQTCSIKIKVGSDGRIDPNSFEFSTLPWAMGQLQNGQIDDVDLAAFEQATNQLKQHFITTIAVANRLKKEQGWAENDQRLTTFEIVEFLKAMVLWTDFCPSSQNDMPALIIQLQPLSKNYSLLPCLNIEDLAKLNHSLVKRLENNAKNEPKKIDAQQQDDEKIDGFKQEVKIFNSFYLRDLQLILTAVDKQALLGDSLIHPYLGGDSKKNPDLLSQQGARLIAKRMTLNYLPLGRWPTEDNQTMSLMQQFAVNTVRHELENSGLYSINGPPGTGKTTLLKDLVAENLVKRGQLLAKLKSAKDAFSGHVFAEDKKINCLCSKLTESGLLVVSNNNKAVENLSEELPLLSSLGGHYQSLSYLKPVARKLVAKHKKLDSNAKNKPRVSVTPLTLEQDCWGLIAVTLGKKSNQKKFCDRVFYQTLEKCEGIAEDDCYNSLQAELKCLKLQKAQPKKTFEDAQQSFLQAQDRVEQIINELSLLESATKLRKDIETLKSFILLLAKRIKRQKLRLAKINAIKIPWTFVGFAWFLRRRKWINLQRQRIQESVFDLDQQIDQKQKLVKKLKEGVKQRWPIEKRYPDVVFSFNAQVIESKEVQRKALGQCKALNQARSHLTLTAFELQQAWLVEAYPYLQTGIGLIPKVVAGTRMDRQACLAVWRLLFMIVPVISCTFASFSRQFSAFSQGEIPWLFIDEAGQATPQQAAGALFRAKRAVVVGDPRQIEPISSVPLAFARLFAQRELGSVNALGAVHENSVQTLADRANPYGSWRIVDNTWLGNPLRVHRRCLEPMFSLANQIAYNNKMLHGLDNPYLTEDSLWESSAWIDVKGKVTGKHFVKNQAVILLAMLKSFINEQHRLPDLFIITPFKKVKRGLHDYLAGALTKANLQEDKIAIQIWLRNHLGTVHSFQGKEAKTVIFVLGLDESSKGAGGWASAKPNLLNVAATRGQKNLYIIGNKRVWADLPYFCVAAKLLKEKAIKLEPSKPEYEC